MTVSSLPPLHNPDNTWIFPTPITSTADCAQQHALHIPVSMILLISTTDSDNAHASTNNQKVGHRQTPLCHAPLSSEFVRGGQTIWSPMVTSDPLHMHCAVWFWDLMSGELTWISRHCFSRIIPFYSCTAWSASGQKCAWRSTVRQLYFLFSSPGANLAKRSL